jgi:hypothetical protein
VLRHYPNGPFNIIFLTFMCYGTIWTSHSTKCFILFLHIGSIHIIYYVQRHYLNGPFNIIRYVQRHYLNGPLNRNCGHFVLKVSYVEWIFCTVTPNVMISKKINFVFNGSFRNRFLLKVDYVQLGFCWMAPVYVQRPILDGAFNINLKNYVEWPVQIVPLHINFMFNGNSVLWLPL